MQWSSDAPYLTFSEDRLHATHFHVFFLRCSRLCFVNYRLAGSAASPGRPLCWVAIQGYWNRSNGEPDSKLGKRLPLQWLFPTSIKTKHQERHALLSSVTTCREGRGRERGRKHTYAFPLETSQISPKDGASLSSFEIFVCPQIHRHLRKDVTHDSAGIINDLLILNAEAKSFSPEVSCIPGNHEENSSEECPLMVSDMKILATIFGNHIVT